MNLKDRTLQWWPRARQMAISLPMALLASMVLIGINEVGHMQSQEAIAEMGTAMESRRAVNVLLQSMLDAETGQRGYLLTGSDSYLEPYAKSVAEVNQHLDTLRNQFLPYREDLQEMALLSRNVSRKLAEMDLSVRLRKQGNDDAWKFVLYTDVGLEHMEAIRRHARELIMRTEVRLRNAGNQVTASLMLSLRG